MSELLVQNFSISLDGYAAGPHQDLDNPLGVDGERLHDWLFAHERGVDPVIDELFARGEQGCGATIMGRNMFGPIRDGWPDETWRGWWGEDPPFHHPVFVLTHHPRPPAEMAGGTTFHFVTDGIESAYRQAAEAAGGLAIRIGGGASTVRQYLRAGLVDEVHVAVVPILLRGGERLFDGVDDDLAGFSAVQVAHSPDGEPPAMHVRLRRNS